MTKKAYLRTNAVRGETTVTNIERNGDKVVLTLAETWFYPGGGGQPLDLGTIHGDNALLVVEDVKHRGKDVLHIGVNKKDEPFEVGDSVHVQVNEHRRRVHEALHTAGHLIDAAIERLGFLFEPKKAFNYPQGPSQTYRVKEVPDGFEADLKAAVENLIGEGGDITYKHVKKTDLDTYLEHEEWYDFLPADIRLVNVSGTWIPCVGTHVQRIEDISNVAIRYVEHTGTRLKIGYKATHKEYA